MKNVIRELQQKVQPNVYIVLTCRQGIATPTCGWVKGNEYYYEKAAKRLLKKLTIRIFGSRNWRRKGKLIKNVTTLEGGKWDNWHINICIKKPDYVNIEKFEALISELWSQSEWSKPNIYVRDITGDAMGYSMKEGMESLLPLACSF